MTITVKLLYTGDRMAYLNKRDTTGEAFVLGENAESSFFETAKKYEYEIWRSSEAEEIRHIDFHIKTTNGLKFSVDVKSMKKTKRSDSTVNNDFLWVEFKNVLGFKGWLYGDADFIAFERENDFLIVNRKSLARLCEKLVDLTRLNEDAKIPLYTAYQRKGRKDLLSLIKVTDILFNIKYSLLKK